MDWLLPALHSWSHVPNDHKMDFDVKQTYILVVQQFQVVYLFHQDDNLDAKQEFVHYLPMIEEKKSRMNVNKLLILFKKFTFGG